MTQLLGVRLDDMVHLRFKILCVQKRLSMSAVAKELIEAWIAEQEGQQSAGPSTELRTGQEKKEGES